MNILLVCAGGMSTSILAMHMQEYADKQDLGYKIWATDYSTIKRHRKDLDVILVGPQVANYISEVRRIALEGTKVAVINETAYGMMDGAFIVEQIRRGEIE
ncbi:PTS sugar transporter subunit IIB [Erysipelothrix urinaevulpis]|uniref:PTS sugar transporter subunit IIB n=1 Tax=Erysipelothrix urinaevulpis TaxID=2683717 RepID=UPI00135B1A4B|nr:PTS sugar transporter subunit IIB [Erysipelothrix urinaevulpis]